ncbi:glycosyltransferase [Isoptericola cucumis]|uniref:glycosyltransferase n=1 Tax=Isoptericola cucumis TaxID=1776856 RepID=UPI0039EECD1A
MALYLGTVHPDRFDVGLALRTARATAGAGTLVLAGPVVDLDRSATAALEQAGVRLLGARHRDDVPAYLQHADVLVVPHVVSPFTESLDPIKLYEYRAVGRPVVSTPVAGFRDAAGPGVVVAAADAFPAAVRDALTRSDGSGRAGSPDAGADAGPAAGIPTWAGQAALMGDVVDRVARRPARLR